MKWMDLEMAKKGRGRLRKEGETLIADSIKKKLSLSLSPHFQYYFVFARLPILLLANRRKSIPSKLSTHSFSDQN
jgi:hypothetical protein